MITVYDPEGKPHTVESVDAKEYLKSGHYTQEPPEPVKPAAVEVVPVVAAVAEVAAEQPMRAKPGPKPKAKPEAQSE